MSETGLILKNVILSRRSSYTLPFPLGNSKEISIPISNLIYVESDGVLSRFHMRNYARNVISVTLTIGECEKILKDYAFVRTHRSYLINSSYISSFECGREGMVFLAGGIKIPVSRRKKKETCDLLKELGFSHLLEQSEAK
jgi:DNA-binding LytR/AlgR family response regulator